MPTTKSSAPKQSRQRRTQQERRAESERRLLEATAELIVESGVGQLSLAAIGRRAGCSHTLVNHLFGTKAALIDRLNAIVDDFYRSRMASAIEREHGVEAVVVLAQSYLALVTSDDPIARVHVVLWAQAVAGSPELRDSRVKWDRYFRRGVAELIARTTGRPRLDSYCETSALVFVGMLRGVAMQQILDPSTTSLSTTIDRVADTVRGLLDDPYAA